MNTFDKTKTTFDKNLQQGLRQKRREWVNKNSTKPFCQKQQTFDEKKTFDNNFRQKCWGTVFSLIFYMLSHTPTKIRRNHFCQKFDETNYANRAQKLCKHFCRNFVHALPTLLLKAFSVKNHSSPRAPRPSPRSQSQAKSQPQVPAPAPWPSPRPHPQAQGPIPRPSPMAIAVLCSRCSLPCTRCFLCQWQVLCAQYLVLCLQW